MQLNMLHNVKTWFSFVISTNDSSMFKEGGSTQQQPFKARMFFQNGSYNNIWFDV